MDTQDICRRLAAMDTATLYESGARATMDRGIRHLSGTERLAGPALTVLCPPGDNLMIHVALAEAKPGEVLVAQCHDPNYGVWGEVLSVAAMARGVAGLVLDGSVRDLAAMRALGFPVFARGTCLRGTAKTGRVPFNVPVTCAGCIVSPGDLVVADESGIVVIDPGEAPGIAGRAEERVAREAAMMEELRRGRTTLELLGLDRAASRR
jgi:4-hydroxy-4-methyl-2-oxoglutarate aldolase